MGKKEEPASGGGDEGQKEYYEKVFLARVAKSIKETDVAYRTMRYRGERMGRRRAYDWPFVLDSLVVGFFYLQDARDSYRKSCHLLSKQIGMEEKAKKRANDDDAFLRYPVE